ARINLQHYLWHDGQDYNLHPSIPTDRECLRVADFGSGTCIWLIEMAQKLHPSARLDALDVSHRQSPPIEALPRNVNLRTHNCLSEPDEDMFAVYDIVHIQNFNSVVRENDPTSVINNALKMLKPGGYLSWGEYDFATWNITTMATATDYNNELAKLLYHNATFGETTSPNFQVDE
ncbi:hypothetical protein K491DRAFT_610791, partial [Lophiostoma macrostomum CBS 122681]